MSTQPLLQRTAKKVRTTLYLLSSFISPQRHEHSGRCHEDVTDERWIIHAERDLEAFSPMDRGGTEGH